MARTRTSLSFRIRYEGRTHTLDRRSATEAQAEQKRGLIRYMVARTLSPFRSRWVVSASGNKPGLRTN